MNFSLRLMAFHSAAALLAFPQIGLAKSLAGDARCFIASNMFAQSRDEKQKELAVQAAYFYLGRLEGSTAQIEEAFAAQAKAITLENAPSTMEACARTVAEKSVAMRDRPAADQRRG